MDFCTKLCHITKQGFILLSQNLSWCQNNGYKLLPSPKENSNSHDLMEKLRVIFLGLEKCCIDLSLFINIERLLQIPILIGFYQKQKLICVRLDLNLDRRMLFFTTVMSKAHTTSKQKMKQTWETSIHLPYSLSLALSNYCLFPEFIKMRLLNIFVKVGH